VFLTDKMVDSNKASQRSELIDYLGCQSFSCHNVNNNRISDKTNTRGVIHLTILNVYVVQLQNQVPLKSVLNIF